MSAPVTRTVNTSPSTSTWNSAVCAGGGPATAAGGGGSAAAASSEASASSASAFACRPSVVCPASSPFRKLRVSDGKSRYIRTLSSSAGKPAFLSSARAPATCGFRRSAGRMVIGSSRPSTSCRMAGSAGTGGRP